MELMVTKLRRRRKENEESTESNLIFQAKVGLNLIG